METGILDSTQKCPVFQHCVRRSRKVHKCIQHPRLEDVSPDESTPKSLSCDANALNNFEFQSFLSFLAGNKKKTILKVSNVQKPPRNVKSDAYWGRVRRYRPDLYGNTACAGEVSNASLSFIEIGERRRCPV